MGQVIGALCEKINGTEWRNEQKKMITDIAFETLKMETADETPGAGVEHMEFDKFYIAVLRIYNEMNKILPGNHTDPPTREELKKLMGEFDVNLDGLLDRSEFEEFIKKISKDTVTLFSTKLMITLVMAPTAALLTKKTTEDVPGVGRAVQKIPTSVYTTLFTFLVVWFQSP